MSELRAGNNTVDFQTTGRGRGVVANVDLLVGGVAVQQPPPVANTSTSTPIPTATRTPTLVASATPSATPTRTIAASTATLTPTPTRTSGGSTGSAGGASPSNTPTAVSPVPPSGATSLSFVQVNNAVPQQDRSRVRVTYQSAQTAGDTNILAIGWNDSTSDVTSVGDSAGNTYRIAAPTTRGQALSQTILYASNINASAAGANVVTVAFNRPVAYADIRILEYRGVDASNPIDVASSASGDAQAGATATTGAVQTHAANTLLFAAGMTFGAFQPATGGFTTRVITHPDSDIAADRLVTAAGAYSASAWVTKPWLMQLVAFKAAKQ
jgi:hypothetical protein